MQYIVPNSMAKVIQKSVKILSEIVLPGDLELYVRQPLHARLKSPYCVISIKDFPSFQIVVTTGSNFVYHKIPCVNTTLEP
jgi:hypothetical protein